MTFEADSIKRFSARVENYIRHRPGYPPEVLELLRREMGLAPAHRIADIGSGPGILSALFLPNGNTVYGVEPNPEMRAAAERLLAAHPHFISIEGTAEATTLAPESVDFITAGQAFHWFDAERSRAEFARVLVPAGWTVLVWNSRKMRTTPFLSGYEELLRRHAVDYQQVAHQNLTEEVFARFFGPGGYRLAVFDNEQTFDFAGLKGRVLSSSYVPLPDHPAHAPLMAELQRLFDRHEENGLVKFAYDTQVYYGRLS